jgi:hypothetical protein
MLAWYGPREDRKIHPNTKIKTVLNQNQVLSVFVKVFSFDLYFKKVGWVLSCKEFLGQI